MKPNRREQGRLPSARLPDPALQGPQQNPFACALHAPQQRSLEELSKAKELLYRDITSMQEDLEVVNTGYTLVPAALGFNPGPVHR